MRGERRARGGGGAIGGAGTIFTKANNQLVGQVIADNGGQSGTNTAVAVGPDHVSKVDAITSGLPLL